MTIGVSIEHSTNWSGKMASLEIVVCHVGKKLALEVKELLGPMPYLSMSCGWLPAGWVACDHLTTLLDVGDDFFYKFMFYIYVM
jgi:hypothetical protein